MATLTTVPELCEAVNAATQTLPVGAAPSSVTVPVMLPAANAAGAATSANAQAKTSTRAARAKRGVTKRTPCRWRQTPAGPEEIPVRAEAAQVQTSVRTSAPAKGS